MEDPNKENIELTPEEIREGELMNQLIAIVKELNWTIAFPSGGGAEDDGNIHGLILGEEAYVNFVLAHLV